MVGDDPAGSGTSRTPTLRVPSKTMALTNPPFVPRVSAVP